MVANGPRPTVESGQPTSRSTAQPGSVSAVAGSSQQFTGEVALSPGSDTLSATVGDVVNDGVRVTVDGATVIDRWKTERQTILGDKPTDYWRLNEPAGSTSAANQISAGPGAITPSGDLRRPDPGRRSSTGAQTNKAPASDNAGGTSAAPPLRRSSLVQKQHPGHPPRVPDNRTDGLARASFVPALYVGDDGGLNGEFWNGAVAPIESRTTVGTIDKLALRRPVGGRGQTLYLDGRHDRQPRRGGVRAGHDLQPARDRRPIRLAGRVGRYGEHRMVGMPVCVRRRRVLHRPAHPGPGAAHYPAPPRP